MDFSSSRDSCGWRSPSESNMSVKNEQQPHSDTKQKHFSYKNIQKNATVLSRFTSFAWFHHLILFLYPSWNIPCINITTGQQHMQLFAKNMKSNLCLYLRSLTSLSVIHSLPPQEGDWLDTDWVTSWWLWWVLTSPSILSAVTDPVPWLWIMGRERAHLEALFAVILHRSPALKVTVNIGSLGIANQGQADALSWVYLSLLFT